MTAIEQVEIGKYYANDYVAVRVDSIKDHWFPVGVSIYYRSEKFNYIDTDTDLDYYFPLKNEMVEISQERFLELLERTKDNFDNNYNKILSK